MSSRMTRGGARPTYDHDDKNEEEDDKTMMIMMIGSMMMTRGEKARL